MAKVMNRVNKAFVRSAYEVKRYRILVRILPIILSCLTVITASAFVVSILYNKYGSYTVTVNKFDAVQYGLTLAEDREFTKSVGRLNAKAAEEITCICRSDTSQLPLDVDTDTGGLHSGENYMAYTYYLKNAGDEVLSYEYHTYIVNETNELAKAVRISIFVDGKQTTYARTKSDGTGPEVDLECACMKYGLYDPEDLTEEQIAEFTNKEFLTARTIQKDTIKDFKPGDVTRFTVVIWLEGDDVDCGDDRLGGQFKIDMAISILTHNGKSAEDTTADTIAD